MSEEPRFRLAASEHRNAPPEEAWSPSEERRSPAEERRSPSEERWSPSEERLIPSGAPAQSSAALIPLAEGQKGEQCTRLQAIRIQRHPARFPECACREYA